MSEKRGAAEANSNEEVLQQENNAKRAKLTPQSDTVLQDLPNELLECILIKTVVMEVRSMKLAKSVWAEKADLVINQLASVCSQWNSIITTDYFLREVHRILDNTAAPVLDNFLLFADGPQGKLFQMGLNGTVVMEIPIQKRQNPVAVDYDPVERMVYWSDVETRTIRRTKLEGGSSEEPFISLMPGSSPEGIAVDSVAKLLFYTDNGRNTVNVVRIDNGDHKVLVAYARHPRAIQVDPINRNIYWTDWGLGTIERVTYNGRHRTVLVEGQDKWINGLALDLLSRMMFWTDAYGGVIERASMDGSGKVVLLDEGTSGNDSDTTRPHYYGITLDGIYIYYTDWSRGVFRVNIDGTNRQRLTPANNTAFSVLNGIKAYRSIIHQNTRGPSSPCRQRNGGCSNLCIPLLNGYTCDCPDFQHLADDNVTCITGVDAVGPDIIWVENDNSSTSYIRGIRGEPKDFLRTRDVFTWSLKSPAWHWTAIDVDHAKKKLFLVDKLDRYLVQLSVKGSLDMKIILSGISSGVNGIAVDWIANNIYWTDGLYKWIAVAKAEERAKGHRTLLSSGLELPYAIAVWPQRGLLFWSDWGTESKIVSATMLGEKVNTLVNSGLLEPKGLVVDYENARLFWCNHNSIESVSINGTDRVIHAASAWTNIVGVALHMNYIIAVEKGQNGLEPQLWIYDRSLNANSGFKLELSRHPSAVVMYDSQRQEKLSSPCGQLACEHLCITTQATTAQCVCFDGFNIAADQRHCIENRLLLRGPAYVYSLGDQICSVPVHRSQTFIANPDSLCFFSNPLSPYEFRALDFNYRRGELFFSETSFRVHSIRRAHIIEKQNNSAIIHGIGLVKGIALDWMSENLYWTDASMNQIWMSRADGRYQKIIARNLSQPHGIVIDMARKKLYWTENGNHGLARIAQANLNGSDISTLFGNVERPAGLGIEYNSREDRLYWTDVGRNTIESLGLSSMLHRFEKIPQIPEKLVADVASYQDFLVYTSSEPNNVSTLHVFEKTDQREVTYGIRHPSQTQSFDVIVFAEAKQPLYNGPICGFGDNEGCEQLLIQTNDGLCLCSCSDGFILHEDKKTCISKNLIHDNFFLVADDYRYQIYQTDGNFRDISAVRFPPQDRPIGLDYDFKDDRIYWTDFETSLIKRSFLNGSGLEVIHNKIPGSRIDGIAVASESRLLYFADSGKNEIGLMTLDGKHKKMILKLNLSNPRGMILDEANGFMYYASRNASSGGGRIDRCGMDGSNCITLIKSSSSWPTSITVDVEEKQIYWCDSHTEKIEAASLDGSKRRTIYRGSANEDPFGIALHGPYIYWTDWNTKGISRVRRDGTGFEKIFQDFFRGPNEIKFFNRTAGSVMNSCSEKNGGCSHFCIPTPNQGRICACPDVATEDKAETDRLNCSEIAICSSVIANGHFHQQCRFTVGSSCQFTCNSGYGAATKELITCQHNLQWSMDTSMLCLDDTCPLLTNPENAIVDIDCPQVAAVGVSCSQHCIDGYTWTDGDKVRTCSSDLSWTGQPIVCTAFSCAPLLTPVNAVVDDACPKSSASSGAQCHHRCADGFIQTEGDQTRICEEDVGWSGTAIVCAPVIHGYCPAIKMSHGTHIEPDTCAQGNQPIGTVCQQFCQPGFLVVSGNYSRTCVANHTWTGFAMTCVNQTVVVEVGHPERNHEVGLIVGLTIGMLLISTFIVIAVVALCRYGSPKTFRRHFHESSDFCFHNVDDDLQPVIPPGGLSTPVYYTKHNSATSDGSVSFDNPAYVNANGLAEDRTSTGYGLASAISRIRNMRSAGPAVSTEATSAHPDPINDHFVFTTPSLTHPLSSDQSVSLKATKLDNASQSVA